MKKDLARLRFHIMLVGLLRRPSAPSRQSTSELLRLIWACVRYRTKMFGFSNRCKDMESVQSKLQRTVVIRTDG